MGDLVVCIDSSPKKGPIAPLVPVHELIQKGRIYRINYIGRSSLGKLGLGLEGVPLPPPMKGFAPYRFRKIAPADGEFIAALSRLAPQQSEGADSRLPELLPLASDNRER